MVCIGNTRKNYATGDELSIFRKINRVKFGH